MEQPVIVHAGAIPWQQRYRDALVSGLQLQGNKVHTSQQDSANTEGTHVLLGPNLWRRSFEYLEKIGRPFLVVNRAFLGPVLGDMPDPYVSIGWNGFNNNARFAFKYGETLPHCRLNDAMFEDFRDWRDSDHGPVLVLLEYNTPQAYLDRVARQIGERPWFHRCHPSGIKTSLGPSSDRSLALDAASAAVATTHHSTAAVEVLLRGTPVVSYDKESMTWPITGHSLDDIKKEDRGTWMEWLAWTQWRISEIQRGEPWEWLS